MGFVPGRVHNKVYLKGYTTTVDSHGIYWQVRPERLKNLWNWCQYARKHMPILLPDGRLLARLFRGVPSGLFTTQFLDSCYNAVMICTILNSLGIHIDIWTMLKLMGDDSLTRIPVFIPPSQHDDFKIACDDKLSYYFDAILSVDKSSISSTLEGAEVLSYHNRNGLPSRDELELAARFYHTKARKPTPSHTMAQCIGIAYACADPTLRIYSVCREVFTHYALLGYTPDAQQDRKDLYVYGQPSLPSTFPTPVEITSRLMRFSTRNEAIARDY
jgi:hypothetical protein